AYAGDARIDDTTMGQERLLSFAVDTDVTVDPSVKTTQRVVAARIVRGVLNLTRATEIRQTYAVRNKADRDKTLLIEHPFAPARELLEPNKPDEKTADLYRFKLDIAAGKSAELVVREQEKRSQTITLIDQPLPMLLELAREGQISKATRDALTKAAEMTQQLARLVEELNNAQKQMDRLRQDQDRVRANLRAVQSNSSLARRYTDKLTEQEDQIDQLGARIFELDDQIQQQRDAMATYLSNLSVE
ncbi:MAG: hypothetical protein IT442_10520, partial [Phycisphaeraceae bacterium]|nr:hypothetical protein [Phycisphaeraceae bacterium]